MILLRQPPRIIRGIGNAATTSGGGGEEGGAILLAADWGHATGATEEAVTQNDRLTLLGNPDDSLEVIASTGLDFPTTNVLRCGLEGTPTQSVGAGPGSEMGVGDTRWFRYYMRNALGTGADNRVHPIQHYRASGSVAAWDRFDVTDGPTYVWEYETRHDAHRWSVTLNNDQTYRFERSITRLASNCATLHMRIYNTSNTLLFSDEDFDCINHDENLATHENGIVAGATTEFDTDMWPNVHWLIFGNPNETLPGDMYVGGFAISADNWLGPYVAGEAD